jgi:hypothetical protein
VRWIIAMLTVVALAGCVSEPEIEGFTPDEFPLTVYRHSWAGSDVFVPGTEHGMAFTVTNPSEREVVVGMFLEGTSNVLLGPIMTTSGSASIEAWQAIRIEGDEVRGVPATLAAGTSTTFLGKVSEYSDSNITARFLASDPLDVEILYDSWETSWTISTMDGAEVTPTTLVQTTTVGLWTNGTSFYTNSAELLADPTFPAGGNVNRGEDTATLPIYVFDNDRSEQPLGNGDNCYFTTISGYNALLDRQSEFSTGVSLIQPSQAYSIEGNEGHLLFGDPLIFLNTIVTIDGQTSTEDELPDPAGACFDAARVAGKIPSDLPL